MAGPASIRGWAGLGAAPISRWDGGAGTWGNMSGRIWILDDELRLSRDHRRDRVIRRDEVVDITVRAYPMIASRMRVRRARGRSRRWAVLRMPRELAAALEEAGWPVEVRGWALRQPVPPVPPPVTAVRDLVAAPGRSVVRGWIWVTPDAVRIDLPTRRFAFERVDGSWSAPRAEIARIAFERRSRGRAVVRLTAFDPARSVTVVAVRAEALRATLMGLGWPVLPG